MANLEADMQEYREREAIGWVVVSCDDTADGEVVNSVGLFPDGPSALIGASRLEANDKRAGVEGWRYVVVPVFPIEERR